MKKIIIIIIATLIIGLGIYLNRAYTHIYNLIGEKNLPYPQNRHYFVGEKSNRLIKIAFLGDSLTAGVGANSASNTYPYLVSQKISQNETLSIETLNLGVPGAKTKDILNDQIDKLTNFKPDIILLFTGINDMHNRIPFKELDNNFFKILELLKDTPEIYLINVPYLGNKKSFLPPYQTYFDWQTKKYNQELQKIALNNKIILLDLYSSTNQQFLDDPNLYANDLFHPNNNGYKLIANKIVIELNKGNN